jgi:hypothetical protein
LTDPDLEKSLAKGRAAPAQQLEEGAFVRSVGVLEDLDVRQGLAVEDKRLPIANGVENVWMIKALSKNSTTSVRIAHSLKLLTVRRSLSRLSCGDRVSRKKPTFVH